MGWTLSRELEFQQRMRALDALRSGRVLVFTNPNYPDRYGVALRLRDGGIKYRLFFTDYVRFLAYENVVSENDVWELMTYGWEPRIGKLSNYRRR